MIVLLDSGPLGFACHPRPRPGSEAEQMQDWLVGMLGAGHRILVPAITDYETRREFVRGGMADSITNLDLLRTTLGFLPLTDEALRKASDFWADVRNAGLPTGRDAALDGDAILAAQAATLQPEGWGSLAPVVVATTNVRHLDRFVSAHLWSNLTP